MENGPSCSAVGGDAKRKISGRGEQGGAKGEEEMITLLSLSAVSSFFSSAPLLGTKSSNENTTQASTVSERPLLFFERLPPQGCTFCAFHFSISANYKLVFISKYTFLKNNSFDEKYRPVSWLSVSWNMFFYCSIETVLYAYFERITYWLDISFYKFS